MANEYNGTFQFNGFNFDFAKLENIVISRIMSNVMGGVNNHGGFLKAFADTWNRADGDNKVILREAAIKLIEKYDLMKEEYLK